MDMTRRDFIKASAAAGLLVAGVKVRKPVLTAFAQGNEAGKKLVSAGEWVASTCQGCTTWCPVQVKVVDGRAIKVRGNPNAKTNHGNVCPRAHLALQEVYDPDRVKVPMKRTNPKKGRNEDPKFVAISWDEATDIIADKMLELRKTGDTHKLVSFRGRYSEMNEILYSALPKIFGSPNGISHSSICAEAEKFGPYYTEAYWDYRDYDMLHTRYMILWGADPVASNRMVPHAINSWGEVMDRAKIACVDPRLSATAAKADEWLSVIPGEDGALALAIAHVILSEGIWYKPFVGNFKDGVNKFRKGKPVREEDFEEKYTYGLAKWWNLEVKDRTPEWAAERSGISEEQIIRVAREFAGAAPHAISWLSPGAAMQIRGAYSAMVTHGLNALVGSVDHKGGTMRGVKVPVGKIPDYNNYLDEVAKKGKNMPKMDQRGYKQFPALNAGKSGGGVLTNNAADAILSEDPYDIKFAIGYWNNFAFSCTGADRWEKALSKLPFFVHITTHPAETSHFADIVLPAAHQLFEKWSLVKSKGNKTGYLSVTQRMIEPLWDVRMDETEIPWMIAEKLAQKGFTNLLDYFKNEFRDPESGQSPKNGMEFTLNMMKILSQPLWDPTIEKKGDQLKGWEDFKAKGVWNSEQYKFGKTLEDFGTKTTKFEFYSETLKEALEGHAKKHNTNVDDIMKETKYQARGELAFIPHYEEPFRWGDSKEFPFIFVEHRSRLNREGRSANCSWYQEFKDADPGDEKWSDVVKINPIDGKKLGLQTGDTIKIYSPVGEITSTAKLWEGVRPGSVVKCYGQGHWAYGRIAAMDYQKKQPRGGNNNEILPADYERLSGSTARHGGVTRVRIEKL